MNLKEIKEQYDYDNPNGDFFYESINSAEAVQRAKDFRWLIDEVMNLDFKMKQNAEFYQTAEKSRKEAEEEVKELQAVFDLQQTRMGKGTKMWRIATGKNDVLPDLGDLLDWLMDQIEKAEAANAKLTAFINEVKISADRPYLRKKAEKLLEDLNK